MCRNHVDNSTFWLLVKQITKEVSAEEQKTVSNLMFIYYQKLKGKNEKIFDLDNIDSIDDTTFRNWFALNKEQFQTVCSFPVTCKPKHVAVLLCKM